MGVEEKAGENCTQLVNDILLKYFDLKGVKFVRVHRLGEEKDNATRPIIARFHFYPDRDRVWYNKQKLKGTKIVVKEHFPHHVQIARNTLEPVFRYARSEGARVKLIQDTIVIDGKTYTTETVPEKYSPRNMSQRIVRDEDNNQYLLFAGEYSPFSNYNKSEFKINGQKFSSIEQFYCYRKAEFTNDKDTATLVMNTAHPRKIKRICSGLKIDREKWLETQGKSVMAEGLKAKFAQNLDLRNALRETRGKTLVEATVDRTWGNGCPLLAKDASDLAKWSGTNLLGHLLMELRESLL